MPEPVDAEAYAFLLTFVVGADETSAQLSHRGGDLSFGFSDGAICNGQCTEIACCPRDVDAEERRGALHHRSDSFVGGELGQAMTDRSASQ